MTATRTLLLRLLFQLLPLLDFGHALPKDSGDGYFAHCSPRLTYCLFSDGKITTIESLAMATETCKSVQPLSRVVKVENVDQKSVLTTFIRNYTLHNVIVDAVAEGDNWAWSDTKTKVDMSLDFKSQDGNLFFMTRASQPKRTYIVCMTGCFSTWKELPQVEGVLANSYMMRKSTFEGCKMICEQAGVKGKECVGVDDEVGPDGNKACAVVFQPGKVVDANPRKTVTHHKIDRTMKNVKRCVGEIKVMDKRTFKNNINYINKFFTAEKSPWATYVMACMVSCALVMICYGLTKKGPIEEEESEEYE